MGTRRELDLRLEAYRALLWRKDQELADTPAEKRLRRMTLGREIADINDLISKTKSIIYGLSDND